MKRGASVADLGQNGLAGLRTVYKENLDDIFANFSKLGFVNSPQAGQTILPKIRNGCTLLFERLSYKGLAESLVRRGDSLSLRSRRQSPSRRS
jgi:hypothetical protein